MAPCERVPREEMGPAELVEGYKALRNVERAFCSMKTMHLELRPVFHRLEDRVRAHVFLCLLAYYVQWHMERALRPIREAERTLYGSLRLVLERLNEVRLETLEVGGASVLQSTIPDEAQQKILDCLGITNLA